MAPPPFPPAAASPQLHLDAEQRAVVERDLEPGELLAVVAAAGAGKSTVLLEYARRRPNLTCLYLTFAKDDMTEKQRSCHEQGLNHVHVKTTHSLAFQPTKAFHHKNFNAGSLYINFELLPVQTPRGMKHPKGLRVDAAKLVKMLLGGFFASKDRVVSWTHLPRRTGGHYEQVDANGWDAVLCAQSVWSVMCDPKDAREKLTHDAYVKLFQLDRRMQQDVLGAYHLIMLDEAHDCTPAQIDLIENAKCRRLAVYDPHQCIYQFRGARDAATLESLHAVARLPLTQAYRYGAPLSVAASLLIQHYKGGAHANFHISGSTTHSTYIRRCSGLPAAVAEVASRAAGGHFHCVALARLNKTLVVLAVELMEAAGSESGRSHTIAFAGGKVPRESECLDVARLKRGVHDNVSAAEAVSLKASIDSKFVQKFVKPGGFELLQQAVEKENKVGEQQELADALALLEQYGAEQLEQHINALKSAMCDQREAEVLFSTTHKSKGLGWPHVFLADDFMARGYSIVDAAAAAIKAAAKTPTATLRGGSTLTESALICSPERIFPFLGLDLTEEVNTTYVGMTRAKSDLFVTDTLGSWLAAAKVSGFEDLMPLCVTHHAASPAVAPSAPASSSIANEPRERAAARTASPHLYSCDFVMRHTMPASFTSPVVELSLGMASATVDDYVMQHHRGVCVSTLAAHVQISTVCARLREALLLGRSLRLDALAQELRTTECPMPGPEQWRLLCEAEVAGGFDAGAEYVSVLKPIISTIVPEAAETWCVGSREQTAISKWYECGRWWAALRRVGFTGRDYAVGAASRVEADDDGEEEVLCVGERSVEERNAEGFAAAIDLDASPAGGVKVTTIDTDDDDPTDDIHGAAVLLHEALNEALKVKSESLGVGEPTAPSPEAGASGRSKRERKPTQRALEAAQGAALTGEHPDEENNGAPRAISKRRRR